MDCDPPRDGLSSDTLFELIADQLDAMRNVDLDSLSPRDADAFRDRARRLTDAAHDLLAAARPLLHSQPTTARTQTTN